MPKRDPKQPATSGKSRSSKSRVLPDPVNQSESLEESVVHTDQVAPDENTKKKRNVPTSTLLGSKLRTIRLHFKLNQEAMAQIIKPDSDSLIHRSRVSQYESGSRIPSLIEVLRYAHYADVTMDDLVNDELELPKLAKF